jgi:uncharacterized membrane protein YfcA
MLIVLGILTGFISGFFGVGGGMFLVPMLLLAGYSIKTAVAISVVQMFFSSLYGTFLNYKQANTVLKDGLVLGIGGAFGGMLSGIIMPNIPDVYLKYILIIIVIFAIYKIFYATLQTKSTIILSNYFLLFIVGLVVGLVAICVGVGGAVLLTPILVGYFAYDIKYASSMSLFFVIFSSCAGLISLGYGGHILYQYGILVGFFSLFGVYFGIKAKNLISLKNYKNIMLIMYSCVLVSLVFG